MGWKNWKADRRQKIRRKKEDGGIEGDRENSVRSTQERRKWIDEGNE